MEFWLVLAGRCSRKCATSFLSGTLVECLGVRSLAACINCRAGKSVNE